MEVPSDAQKFVTFPSLRWLGFGVRDTESEVAYRHYSIESQLNLLRLREDLGCRRDLLTF